MKAKILVYALPALILATIHLAEAQQGAKDIRIGYLDEGTAVGSRGTLGRLPKADDPELGWVEGKNLSIEYRYAGKQD